MHAKFALSFAVAALILAIGGFFAVLGRLGRVEEAVREGAALRPPTGRPAGLVPGESAGAAEEALEEPDAARKLDWVLEKLQGIEDDAYQYRLDLGQEVYDLQTEIRQLKALMRRIVQGLGEGSGGRIDIGWGLRPRGAPMDEATARAYKAEAEKFGIEVKEGEVRVRGFLNFSPNVEMPIEYFVTRYPNAGHETLVHLLGNRDIPPPDVNPYQALRGLATALYKGMLAAGFEQGEPSHPDPNSDAKNPDWVLATGDTVYIGVRYERDGEEHVALATDWVLDPQAGGVLPPDAFRFTGSARGADPDTGEPQLAAESLGLLVSVWPNAAALVEVALPSSFRNDYTYNFSRIPKAEGEEPLFLDLVFSRTPIEPKGDGALPLDRPAPIGGSDGK
jgi:hypothetical protein